jgi:hypothetical protein
VAAESTISSLPLRSGHEPIGERALPYLVLVALADEPTLPSSRHLLEDTDEVWFGRGPREAARVVHDGRRILQLRVPDSRMSGDHGALVRGPTGWVFRDPRSKNGAVVAGEVTRRALVRDGTVLELGHTFFLFCSRAIEDGAVADRIGAPAGPEGLATFVGPLADRFAALARIADTAISVVLLGETGTGKEVTARALHVLSARSGPFVAVNCGALPPSLIEAELFGSRRGAYTNATTDRVGLVRTADRGTLLLDEIGELPPAAQVTLLRVLQEREVMPVGSDHPVKVELRICVATLRDLAARVDDGAFRHDLYARLLGFTLTLPPMRERKADFGLILGALLPRIAGGQAVRFTPAALRKLLRHDWPFNIRELERTLATAVALAPDGLVDAGHLPDALRQPAAMPGGTPAPPALAPEDATLRTRLIELLTSHHGNVVAVGRELGARRTQIYRWAHRLGIEIASYRR